MTARNESSNTLVRRTLISYLLGTFFFKDKKMNDSKEKATTNNTQTKNVQFAFLTTTCYNKAISGCVHMACDTLFTTSLLQIVNRLVASRLSKIVIHRLAASRN